MVKDLGFEHCGKLIIVNDDCVDDQREPCQRCYCCQESPSEQLPHRRQRSGGRASGGVTP